MILLTVCLQVSRSSDQSAERRCPAPYRPRGGSVALSSFFATFSRNSYGSAGENAGSVAGVFFAAARSAVSHAFEHLIRVVHDLPGPLSLMWRDKADAAGIVLEGGVVQGLAS